MNSYEAFARVFRLTPGAVCLEDEDGTFTTYADLDRETARVASFLSGLGLSPEARIAAQIEKSPAAIFLYLGVLRAGFRFVPWNVAYRTSELRYLLSDAEPEVFVCRPGTESGFERGELPKVRHVVTLGGGEEGTLSEALRGASTEFTSARSAQDEPAVIIYTSGTTGRSKGALLTHGNLTSNAEALVARWKVTASDVLIHALPLFHVHGLFVALHTVLLAGARILFQRKFHAPSVLAALPRATLLMGVPTFYTRLLAEPALDRALCRRMRLFISGSAPLLSDTFRAFRERTGHDILERYGMSEAGMITSNPVDGERREGSVGTPLSGVELRVVDSEGRAQSPGAIGDIEIKGPNVFSGYHGRDRMTDTDFTSDGYFRTGDLGAVSADGYLTIVGRSKDLIITGGYNVYPKELELVIDALPEVEESAVIGLPDPDLGEAVTAVVVCRAGHSPTEPELIGRLKSLVAGYKVPRRIVLMSELPRNAMGKVEKGRLRKELGGR